MIRSVHLQLVLEVPNVMGVFVRPSGYIKLGESTAMDPGMWPEADKIVLVLPSLEHNFELFTRVLDNAVGSGRARLQDIQD
jgi:hypothetical protein